MDNFSQNISYNGFAYIYDKLTDDVEYEKRAEYIEDIIKKHTNIKPGLMCDLACGTGTMCRILSKKGYDMIGIDSSPDMLNVANQKSEGLNILYLNQDITNFELYGTVDVIICMLDSVNYLTGDGDVYKLMSLVKNYLNPNGLFIFDVNSPYKFKKILNNNIFTYEQNGIYYTWENCFDGEYCDFYLEFFVQNDNGSYERISETHTERMYTKRFLKNTVKKAGLKLEACYKDLTFKAPSYATERLVFVAKKC